MLIGHMVRPGCRYPQKLETSYISLTSKGIIHTVVYSYFKPEGEAQVALIPTKRCKTYINHFDVSDLKRGYGV